MNFRIFAESLTLNEINELSNILWEKKKEFARQNLKPLTPYQCKLISDGRWIEAIKDYRLLHHCSLLEAKLAIDNVRFRSQ